MCNSDISMIIANPYTCNMLADQIFLKLKELSTTKKQCTVNIKHNHRREKKNTK